MGKLQKRQEATVKFEKYLVAYQKMAMFLMIPALLSTFWAFIPFGNPQVTGIMTLGSARMINGFVGESFAYGGALESLGILMVAVLCTVYAAKGKLPFYLAALVIYAIDLGIDIYLLAWTEFGQGSVFSVIIHSVFVIAFSIGIVLYFKARKYLTEEQRLSK